MRYKIPKTAKERLEFLMSIQTGARTISDYIDKPEQLWVMYDDSDVVTRVKGGECIGLTRAQFKAYKARPENSRVKFVIISVVHGLRHPTTGQPIPLSFRETDVDLS